MTGGTNPISSDESAERLQAPGAASEAPLEASAVVCTYDEKRWPWLEAAVASLRAQRRPPAEIIVVVDHNPALLERVRRELPAVVAIANHHRRGLSGARNSAVEVATCPVLAFLDDDARACPDWLPCLVAHLTDPSVAGAGSAVVPVWVSGRPGWFPPEFDWVVGCTYVGTPTRLAPVRNPFGGAMVIRRRILETVGAYRTDLGRRGAVPLGCEETELCLRIRRHSPEMVFLFDPAAEIVHHVPPERATWRYFSRRCYAEGLSKAVVRAVGGAPGTLAIERAYVTRTLARGMWRGLTSALRGELSGLARAAAILVGLGSAGAGYAVGRLSPPVPARKLAAPAPSISRSSR